MNLKIVPFLLLITKISSELAIDNNFVGINKCCENNELFLGKNGCSPLPNETLWKPLFTSENGKTNIQQKYRFINGQPDCGPRQKFKIYHYANSTDRLIILPSGILRHFYDRKMPNEAETFDLESRESENSPFHDYPPGQYCMEKAIDGKFVSDFAWVCAPDHHTNWTTTEFIMRNIVNPISHGIAIVCLTFVAIVYFIMPTLRDLVGNMVTTICMCLVLSQSADLIRLLTVFDSHISRIITETICYVSLLGAFFWLNSLGFYIWKTFRSRNVFLRITDGKKYCYYSAYAWLCTCLLGVLAVFAHFTMDYPDLGRHTKLEQQEEIGSLGIIIFFVPVAFTILMDVFFFASTLKIINKMHTYGRIHHKLRHSFRMFLLLLLVMTITWIFFMMSFFKFDGLINFYIILNSVQGPLVLYICVLNQKHVSYLLNKTCCYHTCYGKRPPSEHQENEWGDEMSAMNTDNY